MFFNLIKLKGTFDSNSVVKWMKVIHRLSNRFSLTEIDMGTATAECLVFDSKTLTLSSGYATIPWGNQGIGPPGYIKPLLLWFIVMKIGIYSRFGFALLTWNAFYKYTICGLTECLIKHYSIVHYIVSKKLS